MGEKSLDFHPQSSTGRLWRAIFKSSEAERLLTLMMFFQCDRTTVIVTKVHTLNVSVNG